MGKKESKKRHAKSEEELKQLEKQKQKSEWERKFLHNLMLKFLGILENIPEEG